MGYAARHSQHAFVVVWLIAKMDVNEMFCPQVLGYSTHRSAPRLSRAISLTNANTDHAIIDDLMRIALARLARRQSLRREDIFVFSSELGEVGE